MELEQRTLELNLNLRQADEKRIDTDYYVEGFATTFSPYVLYRDEDGGEVKEMISRGAFKDANMSDVIFQYDHQGRVLARQSNGTLGLEVTDDGLLIYADLGKSEASRQMYEEIKAGLVTKMSWRFMIAPNGRTYDPVTKTIYVNRVSDVYDVSAVSIPANDQTSISARSFVTAQVEAKEAEDAERQKRIRRLKLMCEV